MTDQGADSPSEAHPGRAADQADSHVADLRARLAALADAAALMARHGVDHDVDINGLLGHAEGRLRHGTDRTVVALAGGTGAGKSTLLNAVAGAEVARTGVTRPTTSVTQAVVFGRPADGLLDHIGVARRHHLPAPEASLDGLVLLDLPDFDSVADAHRAEVDRLVGLVDLMVWVTDPQKYADQALHEGYLRPLAGHAAVIEVVLNKADLLAPAERDRCIDDLARLLAEDGLGDVGQPLAVSAATGEGMDGLRGLLAAEVQARQAVVDRLSADVHGAASTLAVAGGDVSTLVPEALEADLVDGLAEAAGVGHAADLVAAQHRRDAALRTGWPPVRWLRRWRRSPLSQLPVAADSTVARAEVSRALRQAGTDLGRGTTGGTRQAAVAHVRGAVDPVVAALDTQMGRRTQGLRQPPRWWQLAGVVQTMLLLAAAAGAVWLLGAALGESLLRLDVAPFLPAVGTVPLPTVLLLGGLAGGLVVALLGGLLARVGARRRARQAAVELREGVALVAEEVVLDQLRLLQSDSTAWRELLARAAG